MSMTFITAIFQFYCKGEYKQEKRSKIERDMCTSDSISPYLQSNKLFKWLLKFISS